MANPFVHLELNTVDPDKAKDFYRQLFDWQMDDMPMAQGTYTLIKTGKDPGGGLMKHPMPGAPSQWLPYVGVDDIHAATEKAKALGATVLVPPGEIPNVGWFSIFLDPTGAALALFKPK
jgi:predicted enzyme related to lactoylglutathione lyase